MSLELLEVTNRRDLKRWVQFVYEHYRDAPAFVPQLMSEEIAYFDRKKNPVFEVAQVADGEVYVINGIVGKGLISDIQYCGPFRSETVLEGIVQVLLGDILGVYGQNLVEVTDGNHPARSSSPGFIKINRAVL